MRKLAATLCLTLAVLLAGSWASAQASDLPPCPEEGEWSECETVRAYYGLEPPCPEEGEWSECFGTWTYDSGATYVGEWLQNQYHGWGTFNFADGSVYVGEWQRHKFDGKGIFTYGPSTQWAGDKYVGEWAFDKMQGWGTYFFGNSSTAKDGQVDGQVWRGNWSDNEWRGGKKFSKTEWQEELREKNEEKEVKKREKEARKRAAQKEEEEKRARIDARLDREKKSKKIEQENDNIRIALDALNYTFVGNKKERKIIVLDAKNCKFESYNSSVLNTWYDIFFLNNVIVDTIIFENKRYYNEWREAWMDAIVISFSGDEPVFYDEGFKSEKNLYEGVVSDSAELQRVRKAWGVIFSKACKGASAGEF